MTARQGLRAHESDGRDEARPVERHGREGDAAIIGVGVHRRHDLGRRIVEGLAEPGVDQRNVAIAAIAEANALALLTRNVRDFAMICDRVVDPFERLPE